MKYKNTFVLSVISQIIFDSKEAYTFLMDRCVCVFGGVKIISFSDYFNVCVNYLLVGGMKFLGRWTV